MAPSVLGKRSRSSAESPASSPVSTRAGAKRRAQVVVFSDENEDPFVTRGKGRAGREVPVFKPVESILDVLVDEEPRGHSSPAKHGIPGERLPLSPTKINRQFKTTKLVSGEKPKVTQTVTPQTPRHRDALSRKVLVTPKHRVTVPGKPLTPRTPRTPSTPSNSVPTLYNAARQLFVRSAHPGRLVGRDNERAELDEFIQKRVAARRGGCLYVSGPPGTGKSALVNEVCGSLKDAEAVKMTYVNCMSLRTSQDLYGKLIEDLCEDAAEILEGEETAALQRMFAPRKRGGIIYMVTLDEIDHLLTLDLEVVYKLFVWSLQPSSQLILIGIANALDFTDRFLPKLKARNLKPQLLPFLPYAAPQISSVITTRLRSLLPAESSAEPDFVPFIHPAATQLCSRKVASQTGDIRKAFDICRRAIDLVEAETKLKHQQQASQAEADADKMDYSPSSKAPLLENINLSSSPSPSSKSPGTTTTTTTPTRSRTQRQRPTDILASLTPETAPRATIAHVARVTSAAFGNNAAQRLQSLNLQQKAALCVLVALEKRKRAMGASSTDGPGPSPVTPSKHLDRAAPTVRALFQTYAALCRHEGLLQPLTSTEFGDVVASLETLSLVSAVEGRAGSFAAAGLGTPSRRGRGAAVAGDERRVGSCVGERELVLALEGPGGGILRGLLLEGQAL